jgi:hypothetical protein
MERIWTVQRIDNKKTTSRAVIGAEEHFYKVHDGRSVALTSKVLASTKQS